METFLQQHQTGITNRLYATKHQSDHPSKIGKGIFPDAFLDTGSRIQPAAYLQHIALFFIQPGFQLYPGTQFSF